MSLSGIKTEINVCTYSVQCTRHLGREFLKEKPAKKEMAAQRLDLNPPPEREFSSKPCTDSSTAFHSEIITLFWNQLSKSCLVPQKNVRGKEKLQANILRLPHLEPRESWQGRSSNLYSTWVKQKSLIL